MSPTVVNIIAGVLGNLPALISEVQSAVKDEQGAADAQAKLRAVLNDAGKFLQTLATVI